MIRPSRHAPLILGTLGALGATLAVVMLLRSGSEPAVELAREASTSRDSAGEAPAALRAERSELTEVDRSAAGGTGFYHALRGQRFVAQLTTESWVRFGERAEGDVRIAWTGRQTSTIVDRRDGELLVELRHDLSAEVQAVDGVRERMERELREPMLIRMDHDGRILGLHFSEATSRRVRDTIRSLVASFRFVASNDDDWVSSEQEPNGLAQFRYGWTEREQGRLQRIRDGHCDDGSLAEAGGPPVLSGFARGCVDPLLGWCTEAEYEDHLVEIAGGLLDVSGGSRGTLSCESVESLSLDALPEAAWDGPWESLAASTDVDLGEGEQVLAFERRFWSERLRGVSVQLQLAKIERVMAAEHVDLPTVVAAKTDLAWLVRLDPVCLGEVAGLLGSVDPEAAQVAISAIGAVGDASCQALLADVAIDLGRPNELRHASLMAMTSLKDLQPTLRSGLEHLLCAVDDPAHATAMLVTGALVGLAAEGEAMLPALIAARPDDCAAGLADWLAALGNTKSPSVADVVRRYLGHADADVRESAVNAMETIGAE